MSEKVPPLELNIRKSHKDSVPYKPNSSSFITYKNPETNRTDRYIPFEFRDRHIPRK